MLKRTEIFLEGIELREAARKENRLEDLRKIEDVLSAIIDQSNMVELIDLATELESRGIVDFGYPKKIITEATPPSPTRSVFGLGWLIFKGKK